MPYPLLAVPALVGGTQVVSSSVGASSGTSAMPANVTSGNILLIAVAWSNATASTPAITKSSGTGTIGASSALSTRANTQGASAGAGGSTGNVQLFACSVTGGGSLTLQVACTSAGFMGWVAMEWSGLTTTLDGSQPANVQSIVTTTGTNNTITANSVVTSLANSLICGFSTDDGGDATWTCTVAGAWSKQGTGVITGEPVFFIYQVANAGTLAPTYTLAGGKSGATTTPDACIGALALQASAATTVFPPRPTIVSQAVQRAAVR